MTKEITRGAHGTHSLEISLSVSAHQISTTRGSVLLDFDQCKALRGVKQVCAWDYSIENGLHVLRHQRVPPDESECWAMNGPPYYPWYTLLFIKADVPSYPELDALRSREFRRLKGERDRRVGEARKAAGASK